jgi:hypothetical protein
MNRALTILTRMLASAALTGPGAMAASAAFAATVAPEPTPVPESARAPRRPVSVARRPGLASAA